MVMLSWQWLQRHDIITMILWYYDIKDCVVMTIMTMTSQQQWIWQHEDNDYDIIMIKIMMT